MGPRSENRGYATSNVTGATTIYCFNGSTVREPWLCLEDAGEPAGGQTVSMGPRSENRGYVAGGPGWREGTAVSMGPRSENRGYGHRAGPAAQDGTVSMGPRSENRGYGHRWPDARTGHDAAAFQWVHGQRTVVMQRLLFQGGAAMRGFQWVHGQRTVVMRTGREWSGRERTGFQWVHGQRTVVMPAGQVAGGQGDGRFNGSTVREPWL